MIIVIRKVPLIVIVVIVVIINNNKSHNNSGQRLVLTESLGSLGSSGSFSVHELGSRVQAV